MLLLELLWDPGCAHTALSGSVWFAVLGGAIMALWLGASLVCRVFLQGVVRRRKDQSPVTYLCLKRV